MSETVGPWLGPLIYVFRPGNRNTTLPKVYSESLPPTAKPKEHLRGPGHQESSPGFILFLQIRYIKK